MKMRAALLAALLCVVTFVIAQAQSLPSAKPEQVGLSSERLNKITATLKADSDKGVIPGAVLLVARHGKVAVFEADFNDPRVAQAWESGGGMVGTAMDYARFLQMVLNGGTLDGKRILGPKTLAYMGADHLGTTIAPGPLYLPGVGFGFGLGFAVRRDAGVSPFAGTVGELNWGGAGGTYFWVDPKEDMFVVFMMQSPKQRVAYRFLLKDMIYAAVTTHAAK